jgi:ribonuclease HI
MTIYCDGTPKGYVAIWKDEKVEFFKITVTTQNEAEYQAVLYALESINSHERTEIVSDSQLIVRQLMGEYRCREPRLDAMRKEILNMVAKRGLNVTFRWVPREENLAGRALEDSSFL